MRTNVVPMRPIREAATTREGTRQSERKWGKKVMALGFCVVPSLLLRAQPRLGLNPTQLAVLMQLCDYWWDSDRKPFPGKKALGERLGLGPRQYNATLRNWSKRALSSESSVEPLTAAS